MSEPKEPITLYVRKEKISHRSDVAPTHIDRTDSSPAQEIALRLHDRACVFQERFLATRTMHFTKAELGWSCPSVETCECMGLLLDFELSSPEISMRGLNTCTKAWAASFVGGKGWINLVEKYSRRALTRETDLLPALSGIAETPTISGDKYAFGFWKSGIQRGDQLAALQNSRRLLPTRRPGAGPPSAVTPHSTTGVGVHLTAGSSTLLISHASLLLPIRLDLALGCYD